MVADLRLAAADLVAAIRGMATPPGSRRSPRSARARTRAYTTEMYEFRQKIARENADRTPVSLERIALELEATLDKDTCYVCDVDSGKSMDPLLSFGGSDKQYFSGPDRTCSAGAWRRHSASSSRSRICRWWRWSATAASASAARSRLWTQARYKAPVLNIVLNNHSYNNERNRIWHYGGRQFKTGRDMTCYLGSPDVDYAKASEAFGVEGVVVKEPGELKGAHRSRQAGDRRGPTLPVGRPHLS